jgi:hypothetical protein
LFKIKESNISVVNDKYRSTKEYALVYAELITAAKYHGTVTYQEIAKIIGLPMKGNQMGGAIGHVLGEISEDEGNHGRPMLSAIAVNVHRSPGPGFFTLAKLLGKLGDEDEHAFWKKECNQVYETWKVILK